MSLVPNSFFSLLALCVALQTSSTSFAAQDGPEWLDVLTGTRMLGGNSPHRGAERVLTDEDKARIHYDLDVKGERLTKRVSKFLADHCAKGNGSSAESAANGASEIYSLELNYSLSEYFYFDYYRQQGREPLLSQVRMINENINLNGGRVALRQINEPNPELPFRAWLPKTCEVLTKFEARKLTSTWITPNMKRCPLIDCPEDMNAGQTY